MQPKQILRLVILIGAPIALTACGGGGGASDTTPPTVVSTAPVNAETGVALNATVTATLSEAVDPASLSAATFTLLQSGSPISGSVTANGSTLSFQPDAPLRSGFTYTATVGAGVTDLAGNAVGADVSWQFTIAAYNIAFVTSVSGNGDLSTWPDAGGLTGLAAADAICQARAQAAGLRDPARFRAWMSDDADDAYCRIHDLGGKRSANCGQATLPAFAGPWVRTDGVPFLDNISAALKDGVVYTPVRLDEFGMHVADNFYFTGTSTDGSLLFLQFQQPIAATCVNWTSSATGQDFWWSGGGTELTSNAWSSFASGGCNQARPLLCMHTGAGPALPPLAANGKKVFLTSVGGTGEFGSWADAGGNTGIAAGDAVCRARAAAAGFANAANFKAWLSDSTVDAKDRITSDGPWVRTDGVLVARDKADLLDGSLFTSVNVDETGAYVGGFGVWSGTQDDGTRSPLTCDDWTDGTASFTAASGAAPNAGPRWSDISSAQSPQQCDNPVSRLRCFED